MNTVIKYKGIVSVVVALAITVLLAFIWEKPWNAGASVRVGDQYQATTTPQVADRTNLCPARPTGMASSTTGILGSVNVLNANDSAFFVYDATTTNNNLRKNTATSSMILAQFPASPTEGSYHFDIEFKRGLLIDYVTPARVSTTTISYRCEL